MLFRSNDVTDLYLKNADFATDIIYPVDSETANHAASNTTNSSSITEWTNNNLGTWSCSATFAYGTPTTLNNVAIPANSFDGAAAALGISVGW